MGRIEGEADRMGLLVDDLLLLARLDQQRPIDRVPVDLVAVAADAVHDASMLAPDREVALSLADGPWPPVVLGDEARLRQVVANLVGNAVRHTPPGSRVDVRVRVEGDPPHGWVVLEVADTGPGLTPEQAARVFERFYRADGARSRGDGGTGLGLAIVAALVEAHGGRVELETAPGAGATFRVLLPAA
jgi:two-component system OmpR family sensor kinase